MGQIVRLPLPPQAYPDAAAGLDRAECVLLLAVRWWVADFRFRADPLPRLREAMTTAGAHDAAFAVDHLMTVIVRSVRRPMTIHCPRCPGLSGDEKEVLNAASLVQAGNTQMAERALRVALLSAPGAEFALGPLQGLAELFTRARLFLRLRRLPDVRRDPLRRVDPWIPSATTESIH
jgi:hypothetical protein